MDRLGVRPRLRRDPVARWSRRGRARAPADPARGPHRPRSGIRAGNRRERPDASDRDPLHQGRERRLHRAGGTFDPHDVVRRGTAPQPGAGPLRGGRRRGGHLRAGRRRPADRAELALHVFGVVPVALVLFTATRRIVRPDAKTSTTRAQLDLGGAVLVTGAMLVFVRAIVIAPEAGWLSAKTLISFGLAVALMAGFVAVERRVERPLVRFGIFRSELLVRANVGSALLFGGATAFNVVNTLYLQD